VKLLGNGFEKGELAQFHRTCLCPQSANVTGLQTEAILGYAR